MKSGPGVRAGLLALGLSAGLGVLLLTLPPLGTDLSAATARARFAAAHPLTPIDFAWFGGTDQFGYSALGQFVSALLGARLSGVIACAVAVVLLTVLLVRAGSRRPLLTAVASFVCVSASLVVGRNAFLIGLALGLGCLAVVTRERGGAGSLVVAGLLGLLAALASPLAGLFLAVAGAVLLLRRDLGRAVATIVPAFAGIAWVSLLFGDGGTMGMTNGDLGRGVVICVVVVCVRPPRYLVQGALVTLVLVVAAYVATSPVGMNAVRLPMTIGIPVVVAFTRRSWVTGLLVVVLVVVAPPIPWHDLQHLRTASAERSYFDPLFQQIQARPVTGRVEVLMTPGYWESAYAPDGVPLARGWLRQQDVKLNPLFYGGRQGAVPPRTPSADDYRQWLLDNAVQWVAVPADRSPLAGAELEPVEELAQASGAGALEPTWSNDDWRLYRVVGSTPIVEPPAVVRRMSDTGLTITSPTSGVVRVRVNYSRWLSLSPSIACVRPDGDRWTAVDFSAPGTVRLTSSLSPTGHCS